MGFGVADLVVTYFLKSTVRAFLYVMSSGWERTTAIVTGQVILEPFLGCPSVKLCYKFDLNGQVINSWNKVPLPTMYDARTYAASFSHNMPRIIRVNPKNPQETRIILGML